MDNATANTTTAQSSSKATPQVEGEKMPEGSAFSFAQLTAYINKRSVNTQKKLAQKIPELIALENDLLKYLGRHSGQYLSIHIATEIVFEDMHFPVYDITLHALLPTKTHLENDAENNKHDDKQNQVKKPHLLLVGGIHGIERIGSRVLMSLLTTWLDRLTWEVSLQQSMAGMAITFVPISNPVGMYLNQRGNGNGVDLMRNAPINAQDKTLFLLGGHRISSKLLWYRGNKSHMEQENLAIENIVERLCGTSSFLLSLDCHSGFGFHDQIWFPYAYRRKPMTDIAPVFALKELFDNGYPHNRYIFEPQAVNYLTHGDLWDHLYKNHEKAACTFIPLTLELGAWNWLKKKPSQLFSMEGLFNPMTHHREQRTLRRHLPFLDFLRHACYSFNNWLPDENNKHALQLKAHQLWYAELGNKK